MYVLLGPTSLSLRPGNLLVMYVLLGPVSLSLRPGNLCGAKP